MVPSWSRVLAEVPSMPIHVDEYVALWPAGTAGTVQSPVTPVYVPPVATWPDQLVEMA